MGRLEEALQIDRDVYSGFLKIRGEEHRESLMAANNYITALRDLQRFEEAKSLLLKTMPVSRRVLGENDGLTLRLRWIYGQALYKDDGATLDDLRKAVTTLEETKRIARRVFGGKHPDVVDMEKNLQVAQAKLRAREAQA